nr:hypothetical protein [Taibaiella soli]
MSTHALKLNINITEDAKMRDFQYPGNTHNLVQVAGFSLTGFNAAITPDIDF